MFIDISGVDRVLLLRLLWEQSITSRFYIGPLRFNKDSAVKAIAAGYIDYFCGRRINVDLSQDIIDTTRYDRFLGDGSFADAYTQARSPSKGS